MRILSLNSDPYLKIPFLNAGKGNGGFYTEYLPVHVGYVDQLPGGIDAIVATADLQGRETFEEALGPPKLLGEVLPAKLASDVLPELGIKPSRTAALLAGDFYTLPDLDRRGGSGDVTRVWKAFGREFQWVAGVAGNHDTFGTKAAPRFSDNLFYLDNKSKQIDGLTISGLGGIMGNPRRLQRRWHDDYAWCLDELLKEPAEILITHDGPDVPGTKFKGSPLIREILEKHPPRLVVRGHSHWDQPLAELVCGTQVLNVDCRVAILKRR